MSGARSESPTLGAFWGEAAGVTAEVGGEVRAEPALARLGHPEWWFGRQPLLPLLREVYAAVAAEAARALAAQPGASGGPQAPPVPPAPRPAGAGQQGPPRARPLVLPGMEQAVGGPPRRRR